MHSLKKTHAIALVALGFALCLALSATYFPRAFAGETYRQPIITEQYVDHTFFTATTTTATSTNGANLPDRTLRIDGAKHVTWYFGRGGATGPNTGTTTFKVQVSRDGSEWFDYSMLQRVTSYATADTYFTRLAAPTAGSGANANCAATSTCMYKMDALGYHFARCIAVEQVDGEHTCRASATF